MTVGGVLVTAVLLAGCLWTPDTADVKVSTNTGVLNGVPIDADFGDPAGVSLGGSIAQVYATSYFANARTGEGLSPQPYRIATWQSDLSKANSVIGLHSALRAPPAGYWANGSAWWSPTVRKLGSTYVMMFSAPENIPGGQQNCLGEARATTAAGPFTIEPNIKWCDPGTAYWVDPDLFIDSNGTPVLLWSIEPQGTTNSATSRVVSERLSSNGQMLNGNGYQTLVSFTEVEAVMKVCAAHGGAPVRSVAPTRTSGAAKGNTGHGVEPVFSGTSSGRVKQGAPNHPGCPTWALGPNSYIENPAMVVDPYNDYDLVVSMGTWTDPGHYYSVEMACTSAYSLTPGDRPTCLPNQTQNGGQFMAALNGYGNTGGASFVKDSSHDGNYMLWAWQDDEPQMANFRDVYATPISSVNLNPTTTISQ